MGAVQTSRAGLGWGEPQEFWSKASKRQQKTMVVEEVTRLDQERLHIKAISQGNQRAWTRWKATVDRHITWADIWRMPQARLSFLLKATYDTLPYPRNLSQWFGEAVSCPLCGAKVALTQGRFRWRHDQVLSKLAEVLESGRVAANRAPVMTKPAVTGFVKPGSTPQPPTQKRSSTLTPGKEWQMMIDLKKQLVFPREILTTTLRPDIVMWSSVEKRVLRIELTIPWEEGMTTAHERKYLKYTELAAECQELLRDVGVAGANLRRAVKELGEEADRSSYWLWLRRRDSGSGSTPL